MSNQEVKSYYTVRVPSFVFIFLLKYNRLNTANNNSTLYNDIACWEQSSLEHFTAQLVLNANTFKRVALPNMFV